MVRRTRGDQTTLGDRFRTLGRVVGYIVLVVLSVLVVGGSAFTMPTPPRTTSLSLVAQMGENPDNQAVWARFVKTYGEHVVYWCKRYGLQDADARDVAQDVLLRFWKHARGLNTGPPRHFRAFLQALIHAAWLEWSQEYEPGDIGQGGSEILNLLRKIPAREELWDRLEQAYDAELLQLAMLEVQTRVEPQTWEAFRLLAVERKSVREVASELGIQISYAYKARSRVQRMIGETILKLEETGAGQ